MRNRGGGGCDRRRGGGRNVIRDDGRLSQLSKTITDQLHGTLDALFHKLHSNSVSIRVKHTEIITKADEEKLWPSSIIGVSSPSSLTNVGKMFSLRGVEHRNLSVSQLKRYYDP